MAHTSLKDGVLSDSLSVEETRLGGFSFDYFGMLGEKRNPYATQGTEPRPNFFRWP